MALEKGHVIFPPVGKKATVMMSGPSISSLMLLLVLASQMQILSSNEPEMILLPLGENATDMMWVCVADIWHVYALASVSIPEEDHLVIQVRQYCSCWAKKQQTMAQPV